MGMSDIAAFDDMPDAPLWGVDDGTVHRWSMLTASTRVTIVKLSEKHHGEERARYPATVVDLALPTPWIAFETHWTLGTHDQGLLTFENGDVLHELFSPIHPYDAFVVYSAGGSLKGWYANVTWPVVFAPTDDEPLIVWKDLFVDIVATQDGDVRVLDEDELAEAGLQATNPELHASILAARDELLTRFRARRVPFSTSTTMNQP